MSTGDVRGLHSIELNFPLVSRGNDFFFKIDGMKISGIRHIDISYGVDTVCPIVKIELLCRSVSGTMTTESKELGEILEEL